MALVKCFVSLSSVISSRGDCSQEIRSLRLERAGNEGMRAPSIQCQDRSLENKVTIIHTLVFLITMDGCGSWRVKKAGRKNIDLFEMWC